MTIPQSDPSLVAPGIAAPHPQLGNFIVRNQPLPLVVFVKRQHRLLQRQPRHRHIFLAGEELVWSQGRLAILRPQDGRVRDLNDRELQLVRRIDRPVTGYTDGANALEHCELMLNRLEPRERAIEATLEPPKKYRPLPKNASKARQPGTKRRWFEAGNIVAMRKTDVAFIVSGVPCQPVAFGTRQSARRHYGQRRCRTLNISVDEIVVARVVNRFMAELDPVPEFRRLALERVIRAGCVRPDLKVRYLPKLCQLRDGSWLPELRDLSNAKRKIHKRAASFNSDLLRPLRELADRVTATMPRLDATSMRMELELADKPSRRKLRSLAHTLDEHGASLQVPAEVLAECERAFRLLPPAMLQSMGLSSLADYHMTLCHNPMVPLPDKSYYIRLPYERVFERKSETRTIELALTEDQATLLHGREFWLIQETTPQTQRLDRDPMPRIVLPISWEEAADLDGVLAEVR